jgi:hypothetical protein
VRPAPPRPDPLTLVSLGLLLVLALLLLSPLLGLPLWGGGLPPVWLVATLLLARLGVQLLRARADPRLRRPGGWLLDAALIVLLLYSAAQRG